MRSKDEEKKQADKIAEANKTIADEMAKKREIEKQRIANDFLEAESIKRKMKYAAEMEELRNRHKVRYGDGKETTLYQELYHEADTLISKEQNSMHDWRSAIMALLTLYGKAVKALNTSVNQALGEGYDHFIYKKFGDPLGGLWVKWKCKILSAIKGDSEVDIPALRHKVTFKDGKLNIADLTRSDGVPVEKSDKVNDAFKAFIEVWLAENNYIPVAGQDGKYVHIASGAALDEAKFNELNNNPNTSLSTFLDKNAELDYEDQETYSHSPSM